MLITDISVDASLDMGAGMTIDIDTAVHVNIGVSMRITVSINIDSRRVRTPHNTCDRIPSAPSPSLLPKKKRTL